MSKQPESLRLADQLLAAYPRIHAGLAPSAAAELRRQHALIAELVEALKWATKALVHHTSESQPAAQKARAALSKAKEQS